MRMVRAGWKPSLREASCWRREVTNGGVGWRRRSLRSTLTTVHVAPASPASTAWLAALELGLDGPVLLRREGLDRPFALADDAHGHRLHAPRREPAPHLLPEERRELVAHEPVEDAARLLRVDQVLVDGTGVLERFQHRLLRDLVEEHAVHVAPPSPEPLGDVPRDRLALAVGV